MPISPGHRYSGHVLISRTFRMAVSLTTTKLDLLHETCASLKAFPVSAELVTTSHPTSRRIRRHDGIISHRPSPSIISGTFACGDVSSVALCHDVVNTYRYRGLVYIKSLCKAMDIANRKFNVFVTSTYSFEGTLRLHLNLRLISA